MTRGVECMEFRFLSLYTLGPSYHKTSLFANQQVQEPTSQPSQAQELRQEDAKIYAYLTFNTCNSIYGSTPRFLSQLTRLQHQARKLMHPCAELPGEELPHGHSGMRSSRSAMPRRRLEIGDSFVLCQ